MKKKNKKAKKIKKAKKAKKSLKRKIAKKAVSKKSPKVTIKQKEIDIKVAKLIAKGKERGFVTYDEILHEFPKIENDAQRVRKAASEQKPEPAMRHGRKHRFNRHHDQPARANVHERGGEAEALAEKQLENRAGAAQAPDDAKERPAPRSAQVGEQKRRISTRDEQENGGMVQLAK